MVYRSLVEHILKIEINRSLKIIKEIKTPVPDDISPEVLKVDSNNIHDATIIVTNWAIDKYQHHLKWIGYPVAEVTWECAGNGEELNYI